MRFPLAAGGAPGAGTSPGCRGRPRRVPRALLRASSPEAFVCGIHNIIVRATNYKFFSTCCCVDTGHADTLDVSITFKKYYIQVFPDDADRINDLVK